MTVPIGAGQLRIAVVLVGVTAAVAVLVLYATGRVGLTSRWNVPSRTFHNGLNYNIVKPVKCGSPAAVAGDFKVRHLVPIASDRGFARFVADRIDQPVWLFLAPKGQACLVTYAQYQAVG